MCGKCAERLAGFARPGELDAAVAITLFFDRLPHCIGWLYAPVGITMR
jgi:hypothetical protein